MMETRPTVVSRDSRLAGLLELYDEPTRELLRRAAAVGAFDRMIFDKVLAADLPPGKEPPMAWDELVEQPYVELLPGETPRYRIKDPIRRAFMASWQSVNGPAFEPGGVLEGMPTQPPPLAAQPPTQDTPEAFRKFACALAAYYDTPGRELERLEQLVICDRDAAQRLFTAEFDAADKIFDLPRCHGLIRLLKDREPTLGASFAAAFQQREGRLATRSRWALDYYVTADYYRRASLEGVLERVLASEEKWVLHVHAPGGLGKTTFLRWVIARRCLPDAIPVAHVDFDFVPHLSVVGEPWRLLLSIARQLDDQLPRRPFRTLVEQNRAFIAQADTQRVQAQDIVPLDPGQSAAAKQEEVLRSFAGRLAESRPEGPVLLILDTLENLNHRRVDLRGLFRLIDDLQTRLRQMNCRGLRVLLAGRIPLDTVPDESGEAVNDFQAAFADKYEVLTLRPFTPDEAHGYLVEKRRLPDDDRVAAIVEKAGGNPLKLKLLADLVKDRASVKADEIRQYAGADLTGLIDRVIDRLHDRQLRWLIRYGVTPRLLTFDFVEQVIARYLPQPSTAPGPLDDPTVDDLPQTVLAREPFKPPSEDDLLKLRDLWDRLRTYTAEASWIHTSAEDPDALSFPPHVRDPMRYLLRRQKTAGHDILLRLHEDALAYFKEKAADEPDAARRAIWLAETVYHMHQAGDPNAARYWRDQLAAAADPAIAEALAREVLRPREQTFEGDPSPDALPWYDDETISLANLELARMILRRDAPAAEVEGYLREAEGLAGKKGVDLPSGLLAYVRGQVLLGRGQAWPALDAADAALDRAAEGDDSEVDLLVLAVDARDAVGRPATPEFFDRARRAAGRAPASQQARLRNRLVRWMWRSEDYERAASVLEDILSDPPGAEQLIAASLSLARTRVALGQEAAAAQPLLALQNRMAQDLRLADGRLAGSIGPLTALVQAELALARSSYEGLAVDQAVSPEEYSGAPFLAEAGIHLADTEANHFVRMRALVCDVPRAAGLLQQQASLEQGMPEAAKRFTTSAQLYLDVAGDYRAARNTLDQARKAVEAARRPSSFRIGLLERLVEVKSGELYPSADGAPEVDPLDALLQQFGERGLAPASLAELIIAQIAASGPHRERLDRLAEALSAVTPPSRRLVLLEGLARCEVSASWSEGRSALLKLLPKPHSTGLDPALAALRLAHVERVFGDPDQAAALLQQASQASLQPLRPALLRRIYRAMDQLQPVQASARPNGLRKVARRLLGKDVKVGLTTEADHRAVLGQFANAPAALKRLALVEHGERIVRYGLDVQWLGETLGAIEAIRDTAAGWEARRLSLAAHRELQQGRPEGARLGYEQAAALYEGQDDKPSAAVARAAAENIHVSTDVSDPGLSLAPPPDLLPPPTIQTILSTVQTGRERWSVTMSVTVTGGIAGDAAANVKAPRGLEKDINESAFDFLYRAFSPEGSDAARELGELVYAAPVVQALEGGRTYDLALATQPEDAGWLPFEWAISPSGGPLVEDRAFRYIYRAMRPPMGVLTSPDDTEPRPVLLVTPERTDLAQQQIRQTRSYEELGLDLRRLYQRYGLEPYVCTELQETLDIIQRLRPGVIHFATGLREQYGEPGLVYRSEEPYMSKGGSRGGDLLQVKQLIDALERASVAPLIILDVPSAPTQTELVELLHLRNLFAVSLVVRGAVLAAGLAPAHMAEMTSQHLVETVVSHAPVGDMVRRLWTLSAEQAAEKSAEQLMLRSTALFTADPSQVFPLLHGK